MNLIRQSVIDTISSAGAQVEIRNLAAPEIYDGIVKGKPFHVSRTATLNFSLEVRHTQKLQFRNSEFRIVPDTISDENILGKSALAKAGLDIPKVLQAAILRGPVDLYEEDDSESALRDNNGRHGTVASVLRSNQLDIDYRQGEQDEQAGPVTEDDDFVQEIGEDTEEERQAAIEAMVQRSSAGLSENEVSQMKTLVAEFADIFRVRLGRDAPAKVEPMTVRLRDRARPFRAKVRQYSPEKRSFLNAFVDNLVTYGFLRPNPAAAWAAALNLVPKAGPKSFG